MGHFAKDESRGSLKSPFWCPKISSREQYPGFYGTIFGPAGLDPELVAENGGYEGGIDRFGGPGGLHVLLVNKFPILLIAYRKTH